MFHCINRTIHMYLDIYQIPLSKIVSFSFGFLTCVFVWHQQHQLYMKHLNIYYIILDCDPLHTYSWLLHFFILIIHTYMFVYIQYTSVSSQVHMRNVCDLVTKLPAHNILPFTKYCITSRIQSDCSISASGYFFGRKYAFSL